MNELDKILAGLVRRTVAGEQQWKRSVSDHEFVTAVDAIAVAVRRSVHNDLDSYPKYQLEIFDENGDIVEVVGAHGGITMAPPGALQGEESARQLENLYALARRSALNTQATLEKLANALEP